MNTIERRQLARAASWSFATCGRDQKFAAADICEFHRAWLGGVYAWAGEYRQVNVSKGGFMFAAASRIPELMQQYEHGLLSRYSPCQIVHGVELARALAETHAELVLIHPFREGNGRVARHFTNLMIWQAGRLPIDFEPIVNRRKLEYFASIRAAMGGDYGVLQALFADLIEASRPAAGTDDPFDVALKGSHVFTCLHRRGGGDASHEGPPEFSRLSGNLLRGA